MPAATAAYRPPPPAPSAYFAMQFNPNASSQQVAAPSTFLCRVPSKTSMQQFPDHAAPQYSSNASTRSSSAVSIAALPSLSNGLNELANITSMEKISLAGTRTAAEGEEMVSLFLHFVLQSTLSSVAYCLLWYPETYFVFPNSSTAPPPGRIQLEAPFQLGSWRQYSRTRSLHAL